MKKYVVMVALVVVLAGGVFIQKTQAAPTPSIDWSGIIQKVVSKFEIAITKINNNVQAQVIHVTLSDQPCLSDRGTDIETGWCPDGTKTSFSLRDTNFKVGESIITAQATNPETPSIVKITNCAFRAVTGVDTLPTMRFVCDAAPLENAILNYTIINHKQ